MKKIISGLTALLTVSTLSLTAAANVIVEPKYPMHGNKCGLVTIAPDIERDVHVVIVQNTPDGDYTYYDEMISVDADDRTLEFALEGKDDVSYTVTIGVPKYKGATNYKEFTDYITVKDTDELTDDSTAGFGFTYNIKKFENEEKPDVEDVASEKTKDGVTDSENKVQTETILYFPIAEGLRGDANGDGIINVRDAAAIASALAKGTELPSYADFNGDGKVNIRDAAAIAGSLLKK